MTLDHLLSGPTADRPNNAPHPMTEAEARGILLSIQKRQPRARRGLVVAKLADAADRGRGRLSPEALALYRAFAAHYGS